VTTAEVSFIVLFIFSREVLVYTIRPLLEYRGSRNQMFALSTFRIVTSTMRAQVVGPNHLIWETARETRGKSRATADSLNSALCEVPQVDVRRPEDVNTWEPGREQCFSASPL